MARISQVRLLLWKNWTVRKRQKMRFFMEIMWPVMLFIGLVWLRKANPLYRQHESMPSAGILPWIQGIFCNANNPCFQHPTRGESPGFVSNYNNSILARFWADTQELLLSDPEFLHLGRVWRDLTTMSKFMRTLRIHPEWIEVRTGLSFAESSRILPEECSEGAEVPHSCSHHHCVPRANELSGDHSGGRSEGRRNAHLLSAARHSSLSVCGQSAGQSKIRPEQFAYGVPDLRLRDISCSQALLERFLIFPSRRGVYTILNAMCPLKPYQLDSIEEKFYINVDLFKLLRLLPRLLDEYSSGIDLHFWARALSAVSGKLRVLFDRSSFKELVQVLWPLFQSPGDPSFSQLMAAASSLICGYTEGAFSRVTSFNWYEDNNYKAFLGINNTRSQGEHPYDPSATSFCNNIMKDLESSPATRLVWNTLKPFLMGKILYTPDSPAIRQLIKNIQIPSELAGEEVPVQVRFKSAGSGHRATSAVPAGLSTLQCQCVPCWPAANSTFEELERLRNIIRSWEEVGPQLWDLFQDNIQMDMLRDIMRNPSVMDYMDRGLKDSELTVRHILNFLYTGPEDERDAGMLRFDWRNIFNLTDRALRMISQYGEVLDILLDLSCMKSFFLELQERPCLHLAVSCDFIE
ncbi:hypothetical protein SRHO_G00049550 [Serrasalmus rhombeus]